MGKIMIIRLLIIISVIAIIITKVLMINSASNIDNNDYLYADSEDNAK